LPYFQPDRIVKVQRQYPNDRENSISIPKYMIWTHNQVFAAMALYGQSGPGMNLAATTATNRSRP